MTQEFIYPAVINYDFPGQAAIIFPDLFVCGYQCEINCDIYAKAQELLTFHIESIIEDGDELPKAKSIPELIKEYPGCSVIPVKINFHRDEAAQFMPPAARLNDSCTGHADWPPRVNTEASPNVFVNSRGWHRVGDSWAVHCNNIPECHSGVLSSGSKSVFVNDKNAGRVGDSVSCGSSVATGSENVFAGD